MYKLISFVLLLISTFVVINSQVYFPGDTPNTFVQPESLIKNLSLVDRASTLSQLDVNVNDAIAKGILKLTLSIDKIISDESRNNIAVYSPVGISGNLFVLCN